MEVVITSSELIKPSSPAPPHQTQFQLSFIDQLNHTIFSPFIYFYSSSSSPISKGTHDHLKKSLSKTLSIYFPLAGRLKDDLYITCSGDGVPYFEARANTHLSQLIGKDPDYSELNKLIPYNDRINNSGDLPLAIMVTFFACGGMCICLSFSHKVMDGLSMITFVNSFAAIARGREEQESKLLPHFGTAQIFPPVPGMKAPSLATKESNKLVTKKFVFSDSSISALKAKYSSPDLNLSRIEALSYFIWNRFVDATIEEARKVKRWYRVIQAVNLRPKVTPPLPESQFGNLCRHPMTDPFYASQAEEDRFRVVESMRDAMRKVDCNYINKLQEGNMDPVSEYEKFNNLEGVVTSFAFSGINRFPMYEADFGWGRPVWVTLAEKTLKNVVVFMPTRSGEGIEALINLLEDDMACLEADKEFLSYVSPPSITKTLFPSSSL